MNLLAIESLGFSYPGRGAVLAGIAASAAGPEVIAIAGPNGAGKSTLLDLLSGQLRPASGTCRIQGRDGLAKLLTEDVANDLALIQLQSRVSDTASISAEPGKLRQGEDIVVFGYPLNSLLSSGGNLTPGVVSAVTGLGNNTNQIQITAQIQPGSSGSPLLNKKGEVVGVVSSKLSDTKMVKATGQVGQNVNFAVSGLTLKAFLDAQR